MLLKSLIPFLEENKKDTKIHFARGGVKPEDALNEFLMGDFKSWQERQSNKNFGRKYVVALIRLGNMEWLFGGIYKVNGVRQTRDGWYKYDTTLTDIGEEYIGRAIIYYRRQFRQSYCCLERYIEELSVIELRRDSYEIPFPGYDKVNLTWDELRLVINTDPWKTALSNQKGVYLIADSSNGKKYVGSATGNHMIWGRWKSYIENGHGGNKDLKSLCFSHIKKYFNYSILEIYKSTTDDAIILEREQWWKEVLLSRGKFGYNKN